MTGWRASRLDSRVRKNALCAAVALACAAAAGSVARAATDTWTNAQGSGHWPTGGNWADGTTPAQGDDVLFPSPGPASHVVTVPAGTVNARTLTFHDSYTL